METRLSKTIYGNDIMNYFFVDDFAQKKNKNKNVLLTSFYYSKLAFTISKSRMETPEQRVESVQS